MSEPEPSRPGSVLQAEREALGVTVREVAETLNLSMATIEALEADDYDRLPGTVFARGYLRAYARLLELPPEPLLARYPQPEYAAPLPQAPVEPPIWEWIRRRPGQVLGGAAGVLALVLMLLTIWLWPEGTPPVEPGAAGTAAESPVPAADPVSGTDEDPVFSAPVETSSEDTGGPALAGDLPVRRDQGGDADPASDAATGEPVAAEGEVETVRRITPVGDDRLTFEFSDDCWVEVRTAAGETLYSDLSRADSRLGLVGQGPFRILLGYAPGVQLSFNGESVPLAPHTRDNVATLVLGQ